MCGRHITTMNRRTITLSAAGPPAHRGHQLRRAGLERPGPARPGPVGSTCCDRVVGEIDVVCCQMRRKWRARIEENCPRSVRAAAEANSMLLLEPLMPSVMCYAEADDG